jgi:hypothetical protein
MITCHALQLPLQSNQQTKDVAELAEIEIQGGLEYQHNTDEYSLVTQRIQLDSYLGKDQRKPFQCLLFDRDTYY